MRRSGRDGDEKSVFDGASGAGGNGNGSGLRCTGWAGGDSDENVFVND